MHCNYLEFTSREPKSVEGGSAFRLRREPIGRVGSIGTVTFYSLHKRSLVLLKVWAAVFCPIVVQQYIISSVLSSFLLLSLLYLYVL